MEEHMVDIPDDPLVRSAERTGYAPWVHPGCRKSAVRLYTDIKRVAGMDTMPGNICAPGEPQPERG